MNFSSSKFSMGNNFVFLLFVILVISRFGFEGWIWVLIASVPDLCILFTFFEKKKSLILFGFLGPFNIVELNLS